MAINQLSTANTFEQWLVATQALIAFANSITDAAPGGTFTSNTSEYIITGNLTVGNTVTCVTMNTDVIIFNDGTRLDSNVQIVNAYAHSNAAFNKANAANVLAQQAYDFANNIVSGGNVVVANTVTGNSIVANVSMTTANITVTNNVTTSNIVVSNNITVTKNISAGNISSGNITLTNNVTAGNISVTNGITTTEITTTNVNASLVTASDINTTSDISLKINLQPIANPMDVLDKMIGYSFNWKKDGSKSYGLSAQEVEKILPDIVKMREDGFKGINYLNVIAFLVEAVKELRKEIIEIKKDK